MLVADELVSTVDAAADRLLEAGEAEASARGRPDGWSAKEIVGHLIDSAANNHQRFVRARQDGRLVFPGYAQNHWVDSQGYQSADWAELVRFWQLYNHHLARLIRRIPPEALPVECRIGDASAVTLEYLIEDYLSHLKHHLEQIGTRLVRL